MGNSVGERRSDLGDDDDVDQDDGLHGNTVTINADLV